MAHLKTSHSPNAQWPLWLGAATCDSPAPAQPLAFRSSPCADVWRPGEWTEAGPAGADSWKKWVPALGCSHACGLSFVRFHVKIRNKIKRISTLAVLTLGSGTARLLWWEHTHRREYLLGASSWAVCREWEVISSWGGKHIFTTLLKACLCFHV